MSLEIVEASAREVFEAYNLALANHDREAVVFWRDVLIDRLVIIHGYQYDRERAAGADSREP